MDSSNNKETKRQHYVPKTYLKHFSEENSKTYFINALTIKNIDINAIQKFNIDNVCLENDLYTLPGNSKEERLFIENFYSEKYETHYDKIYHLLTDPNKNQVTDEERLLIISTVVTMLYRTTKFLNWHKGLLNTVIEKAYLFAKEMNTDYFIFQDEKISIVNRSIDQLQKEYIKQNKSVLISNQFEVAQRLIKLRTSRDGIYVSKLMDNEHEFITSDNPVRYFNVDNWNSSPFDEHNILTFPLDSKHCLSLLPISNETHKNKIVRHFSKGENARSEVITNNHQQYSYAERFILGKYTAIKSYLEVKPFAEQQLTPEQLEQFKRYPGLLQKAKDMGIL